MINSTDGYQLRVNTIKYIDFCADVKHVYIVNITWKMNVSFRLQIGSQFYTWVRQRYITTEAV